MKRKPGETRKKLIHFQEEKYDAWRMDLKESRLDKVARLIFQEKSGKMLDIGCSGGEFGSKFLDLGWKVFGIDIARKQVEKARKRGLTVYRSDMEKKLPFKAGFFDLVFAGEVIEHVADTTKFLKEIFRVLRAKGVLILTTPNLASLENRLRVLLGIQPLWVDFKLEKSSGHIRAYTPSALKEQLEEVGFKVEKQTGNFVPIWQLRWNDLNCPWLRLTGDWLPSLSQCIIIKARKASILLG